MTDSASCASEEGERFAPLGNHTECPRDLDVLKKEFELLHHRLASETCSVKHDRQPDPVFGPPATDGPVEPYVELYQKIHSLRDDGRTALCLSGGGIRSAAFNLGVLQALASLGILDRFHFLSTVSGGGYIGSWLALWRKRSQFDRMRSGLKTASGLNTVVAGLCWPDPPPNCPQDRPARLPSAVQNLRSKTSYLAPRMGLLSSDTWSAIVLFLRNLLLNWLILLPLLAAAVTAPKLLLLLMLVAGLSAASWLIAAMAGLTAALAVAGWVLLAVSRPAWRDNTPPLLSDKKFLRKASKNWGIVATKCDEITRKLSEKKGISFQEAKNWARDFRHSLEKSSIKHQAWLGVGLVLGAASSFSVFIAVRTLVDGSSPSGHDWWSPVATGAALSLGAFASAATVSWWRQLRPIPVLDARDKSRLWSRARRTLFFAGLSGAAGGGLVTIGLRLADSNISGHSFVLISSVAPLWFALAYLVGDAIYLGFTARRVKDPRRGASDPWGDQEREWLARSGGRILLYAAGITLFFLLVSFGPEVWHKNVNGVLFIITLLSFLGSVALGASPLTAGKASETRKILRILPLRLVLAIATPVFIGILITIMSSAVDALLLQQDFLDVLDTSIVTDLAPRNIIWQLFIALVMLLVIAFVAAQFININRFSLHDVYRLRLMREFLGASNPEHDLREDGWTGFTDSDDEDLNGLWDERDECWEPCLYPVINATLNVVETNRLAWQERKGEPFVFTPKYVGCARLGYRVAAEAGGGVRVSSAMTVSGAAVSPNSGYHTTPLLALLLTMFNLRLGVWIGNPANEETWRERGPANALRPLLAEALSLTTERDTTRYVYLSDGGHFDNLGLYEMLRRRCRFILVSDVGYDPNYAYEDLGRVVRQATIDMGIRFNFIHLDMEKRPDLARPHQTTTQPAIAGAYSAFATIDYPELTKPDGVRARGYLLYVKPGFQNRDEPADVRAYAATNPTFPHDTTLNQFFGESQFESYRALGRYIVSELARKAGISPGEKQLCKVFDSAQCYLAATPTRSAEFSQDDKELELVI